MTYPVIDVKLPDDLREQHNGDLDPKLLVAVPGGQLHHAAAAAWVSLRSAASKAGLNLMPTSVVDTYRPYDVQLRIFQQRYDRIPRGSDSKVWNGVRYWLKPGYAMAAVPGTSNHGWGLAVDVDLRPAGTLAWLTANAVAHGFSWEAQSEPWHIRYVLGWHEPVLVPAYKGPYRLGSTGPAVKAVQRGLGGLIVDGIYGAKTRDAVKAYQRKRPWLGLPTGVVNQRTYTALTKKL